VKDDEIEEMRERERKAHNLDERIKKGMKIYFNIYRSKMGFTCSFS